MLSLGRLSMVLTVIMFGANGTYAFEMPKIPSLGAKGAPSKVNAKDVARDTRNATYRFATAELNIAEALGGYAELAAHRALLAGMQSGDAAASKSDLESITVVNNAAREQIETKIKANAQIDSSQKEIASKGTLEYVLGLLATKKMASAIKELAATPPMTLLADAGTVLFLAGEIPAVILKGIAMSGTLLTYMATNGVDVSKAQEAANDLGK